jgi:hypothetical protein
MRCAYRHSPLPDRGNDLFGTAGKTDGNLLHVHIDHVIFNLQKLLKTAPRGCFDNIIFN